MTDKDKDTEQKHPKDENSKNQQQGGLPQEESGGPGSKEKRRNQEEDGQLEQGRENEDHKRKADK